MTSAFLLPFLPPHQFPDDLGKSSTILFICSPTRDSRTGANVGKIQQATSCTHMLTIQFSSCRSACRAIAGIESLLRKSNMTESPPRMAGSSCKSPRDRPSFCRVPCCHQYLYISCGTGRLITSTSCWCLLSMTLKRKHFSRAGRCRGESRESGLACMEGSTLIYSFSSALGQGQRFFFFRTRKLHRRVFLLHCPARSPSLSPRRQTTSVFWQRLPREGYSRPEQPASFPFVSKQKGGCRLANSFAGPRTSLFTHRGIQVAQQHRNTKEFATSLLYEHSHSAWDFCSVKSLTLPVHH